MISEWKFSATCPKIASTAKIQTHQGTVIGTNDFPSLRTLCTCLQLIYFGNCCQLMQSDIVHRNAYMFATPSLVSWQKSYESMTASLIHEKSDWKACCPWPKAWTKLMSRSIYTSPARNTVFWRTVCIIHYNLIKMSLASQMVVPYDSNDRSRYLFSWVTHPPLYNRTSSQFGRSQWQT